MSCSRVQRKFLTCTLRVCLRERKGEDAQSQEKSADDFFTGRVHDAKLPNEYTFKMQRTGLYSPLRGTKSPHERVQSRHIQTRDQQVDVVCSLVCHHRFEVHHVAHDRVFARDAHTAEHLAGFTCHI